MGFIGGGAPDWTGDPRLYIDRTETVSVNLVSAIQAAEARLVHANNFSSIPSRSAVDWRSKIAGDEEVTQADGQVGS